MHTVKNILFLLVLLTVLATNLLQATYQNRAESIKQLSSLCALYQIDNLSLSDVYIGNSTGIPRVKIKPHERKKLCWAIPFVSIQNYKDKIQKNTPYTPQEALKIFTCLGIFRLWRHESGIVCAPDPNCVKTDLNEWSSKTLTYTESLKHTLTQEQIQALKFLVQITKLGKVELDHIS